MTMFSIAVSLAKRREGNKTEMMEVARIKFFNEFIDWGIDE
jgi:hypothetical protein